MNWMLVDFARKIRTGITLAVPVFDGVNEEEIARVATKAEKIGGVARSRGYNLTL